LAAVIFCLIFISTFTAARNFHVTCGTVLKLLNTDYKVRLHSHDVKYGTGKKIKILYMGVFTLNSFFSSGSGQQSVTGIELQEDVNSHWAIQAPTGKTCDRG
jgi:hypothetical protein